MDKAEMAKYRHRLLEERKRLQTDVKQLVEGALDATNDELSRLPTHIADLGSETYSQELALSLAPTEERALELIDRALDRIDDGMYGTCESCGQPIAKARLEALPFTPFCITCATEFEKSTRPDAEPDPLRREAVDRGHVPERPNRRIYPGADEAPG